MRVVYMPVISARNVQAAPSYNFWQAFRRRALEKDPTSVFYVLVPRTGEGTRWKDGADWGGERTFVIEVSMHEQQFDDLALVTREFWDLFNERFGSLYFDVILSERPSLAPMLKKLASFHLKSKSRNPLVVTRDQITLDTEWFKISPIEELLQVTGWASAPTIFQSPHQAKRALMIAGKHLLPSWVNRMAEQNVVFPLGIDCADVDATNMTERGEKYDEITVNYSHKLFIEQKFLESLKIMDSVFAGGRPVRLQIVTGSSASKMVMLPRARQYKYMTTYGSQNRQQFLRQMAKAHVFISNSYYEDFSATVSEQIYTGLVPVLLRADWSEYLVGKEYPFLFDTMDEGQAMMRYVVDHYEAVRDEWVPRLQAKQKAEFDLARIVPDMVDWMWSLREDGLKATEGVSASLREVVDDAYDVLPETFDLPMFYDAIKQVARSLDVTKQGSESMATSPWLCVDLLLHQHPNLIDLGTREPSYMKG